MILFAIFVLKVESIQKFVAHSYNHCSRFFFTFSSNRNITHGHTLENTLHFVCLLCLVVLPAFDVSTANVRICHRAMYRFRVRSVFFCPVSLHSHLVKLVFLSAHNLPCVNETIKCYLFDYLMSSSRDCRRHAKQHGRNLAHVSNVSPIITRSRITRVNDFLNGLALGQLKCIRQCRGMKKK